MLWNTPCPYRVACKRCSLTASCSPFQCICAGLVKLSGLLYCWFGTYNISVLLCICKTTSGLLLPVVAHSCPVCDTWRSQTASKILYSSTNKHKSLTNFLPPSMLYLRFEVLHESYLVRCIVHSKQIVTDLANDSCHFCFPLQHLPWDNTEQKQCNLLG